MTSSARLASSPLEYLAPATLEQLLEVLSDLGPKAKVIAGGTDLVPAMRKGKLPPAVTTLISLRNLSLSYIRESAEGLRIGAATPHADVAASPLVRREAPLLATGSGAVGSLQIRNVATIGGNIANAGPSADTSAPLLALDAQLVVAGRHGWRTLPIREFYSGPSQNSLEPGEVVVEFLLPKLAPHTGTHYVKFSPRSFMDLAWVGVAVVATFDPAGRVCQDARLGLAAVNPFPMRAVKAEAVIRGREITGDLIAVMARAASEECNPNPRSRRVPAWYRREMVAVLTRRGFLEARRIATGVN